MTTTGPADASAVAVIGRDAVATGSAALELARAEARHRGVTIVDLIGDAPPLRDVVLSDDTHGVADCFEYGVSFAAVSRPTTDPHVSVIPSGTEPPTYPETLASNRWERLIAETRERGALVVFAALSGTPGLEALVSRLDFVIPEGLVLPTSASVAVQSAAVSAARPPSRKPRVLAPAATPRIRSRVVVVAGAVAAVLLLVATAWVLGRSGAPSRAAAATADNAGSKRDTLTSTAQLAGADRTGATTPGATGPLAAPVDPQDSTIASAFALRLGTYPTYDQAFRALREAVKRGAATITPLGGGAAAPGATLSAQSFALYVGAAASGSTLDSMARAWARRGGFAGGVVTHTPYALRLTGPVSADSALRATVAWRARGIPAYALDASDGTAAVYAGAFVTIDQVGPLAASLHNVGLSPVLAYRVGQAP